MPYIWNKDSAGIDRRIYIDNQSATYGTDENGRTFPLGNRSEYTGWTSTGPWDHSQATGVGGGGGGIVALLILALPYLPYPLMGFGTFWGLDWLANHAIQHRWIVGSATFWQAEYAVTRGAGIAVAVLSFLFRKGVRKHIFRHIKGVVLALAASFASFIAFGIILSAVKPPDVKVSDTVGGLIGAAFILLVALPVFVVVLRKFYGLPWNPLGRSKARS